MITEALVYLETELEDEGNKARLEMIERIFEKFRTSSR
jgi:hypothetical protein